MGTFAISATTSTSEDAGTTRNGYVPGGSSDGPAVATAASFSFFSFGGETSGSIRNPSERAGIVGFKTSVGTVPIGGTLALVPNRDVIGPMARFTVDSAAILASSPSGNPPTSGIPSVRSSRAAQRLRRGIEHLARRQAFWRDRHLHWKDQPLHRGR